eukprot:scaffold324517_cov46-Prasinocladus_malaysianus.AAC.1
MQRDATGHPTLASECANSTTEVAEAEQMTATVPLLAAAPFTLPAATWDTKDIRQTLTGMRNVRIT